ncbi:MAG: sulfatase-like hydrolase/transferase [Acidobacteriota bacterium]
MGPFFLSMRAAQRRLSSSSTAKQLAQESLTPLAYLILPNLPLLFLRSKLTLVPHGIINIECLLVGVCSLFLPRLLVFLLLLAEIAGSFAYELCYSFQIRFVDLLASLRSAGDLPMLRKEEMLIALATMAGMAALVAFGLRPPRHRRWVATALLGLVVLLSAFDVWDGQNPLLNAQVQRASERLTLSPWVTLGIRARALTREESQGLLRDSPMPSATSAMMAMLSVRSEQNNPDVVVVVVESWGELTDLHLQETMTSPYRDPAIEAAYDVRYGTTPFDGMTVPGELRELCHSHLGFGVLHISKTQEQRCLPDEYRAQGYQTEAIHGYVGGMFQREDWYKNLGFEKTWFARDLAAQGLPECPGAFPGICDPAIADWIGQSLLRSPRVQPRFVYWMTLNSHIPLPLDPELPTDDLCRSRPVLGQSQALCSWFRVVHALHVGVAKLTIQVKQQPTVFVLVGDHAPPFANPALRQYFSDTAVPWIILTPKALRNLPEQERATVQIPGKRTPRQAASRSMSGTGQGQ